MAEELRLRASVEDHATGPLRKIREELTAFRETEGMKSLKEGMKFLREQTGEFTKASVGAGTAMGGIGIGSLAASVSVGELVKSFKELSDRIGELRALSKETGLTVDAINQLEHVADRFHVAPEKMAAGLGVLADKMVDFRRHTGDLFGEINQQRPDLAKRLLGENPEQQVQEILRFLDSIPNAGVRKRWSQAFFGDGDIARLVQDGYSKFAEAQAEASKDVAKITPELQRQAEEFHKSITAFNDSLDNLETKVGPYVFRELKTAADEFRSAFDDIKGVFEWWQGNKDKSVKAFVDDNAKGAYEALKRQHSINEQRTKDDNGPLIDLPGMITGQTHSSDADVRAHQQFQKDRQNLNPLFHKSSFESFAGGIGGGSGAEDIIQRATRAGVVQGLMDYADLKSAQGQNGFGGGSAGGIQKASYETGGQGGFARTPADLGAASGGILDLIRQGETGSLGPDSYKSITSQWKGFKPDVTKMTVDQVIAFQKMMLSQGVTDSAVGGFQINGTTLQDFKNRMHLSGGEMFDPETQTRIAGQILGSTGGNLGALRGRSYAGNWVTTEV